MPWYAEQRGRGAGTARRAVGLHADLVDPFVAQVAADREASGATGPPVLRSTYRPQTTAFARREGMASPERRPQSRPLPPWSDCRRGSRSRTEATGREPGAPESCSQMRAPAPAGWQLRRVRTIPWIRRTMKAPRQQARTLAAADDQETDCQITQDNVPQARPTIELDYRRRRRPVRSSDQHTETARECGSLPRRWTGGFGNSRCPRRTTEPPLRGRVTEVLFSFRALPFDGLDIDPDGGPQYSTASLDRPKGRRGRQVLWVLALPPGQAEGEARFVRHSVDGRGTWCKPAFLLPPVGDVVLVRGRGGIVGQIA